MKYNTTSLRFLLIIIAIATATLVSCATAQNTDVGVFRPSTHIFYLKNGTDSITTDWGAINDKPVTGDWNNDGIWDVGVRRNASGNFYLKNGTANTTIPCGISTDIPVTGDWNGDGFWDVGFFRPSNHLFLLKNGSVNTTVNWGTGTDIPLTGDWNGDDLWDVGVFRPSNHTFYLKNGTINTTIVWGLGTDKPLAGDWNDDGLWEVGLRRNATFMLRNGTTVTTFGYGLASDIPVAGKLENRSAGCQLYLHTGHGHVPADGLLHRRSSGSRDTWRWNFGDGIISTARNPNYTYTRAGEFNVTLTVTQGNRSSTFQRVKYIYAESPNATYGATLVLNSMPTTMFQGEHYLVDIKMNNTGTKKWFGIGILNYVILTGLGGTGGDAAAFNITEIPMIFENETASRGVSYDFFFYVKAPDTLGNYTPQYR